MKMLIALFFILLPHSIALAWPAKVLQLHDGDTLTVERLDARFHPLRVRLYGVDCPETKQAGGRDAMDFLKKLLPPGSRVEVEEIDKDQYGRVVGVLRQGQMTINRQLLQNGHAWYYGRYCKKSFCKDWRKLHQGARKAGLGLWRDKNPLPPWIWRKQNPRKN